MISLHYYCSCCMPLPRFMWLCLTHCCMLNHVFQYAQTISVHEKPCGGAQCSQSVHLPYPYHRQATHVTQTQSTAKHHCLRKWNICHSQTVAIPYKMATKESKANEWYVIHSLHPSLTRQDHESLKQVCDLSFTVYRHPLQYRNMKV